MRRPRVKPRGQVTVFHCISRSVAGQFLFGPMEKEKFCQLMRKHAAFCQMQILTHTILDNHFHIVCRAPVRVQLSDSQLLAALKTFYGPKSAQVKEFQNALQGPPTRRQSLRTQYLARMGDVSVFMKELKQAFSRWFNQRHERFGTLWAERFRSLVVQNTPEALLMVAAYVDLNCLRAGIVGDPKDYRFCGYAQALARPGPAREGLLSLLPPGASWKDMLAEYRKFLFGQAGRPSPAGKKELDRQTIRKVYEKGGQLGLAALLRLRVRYFSYGVVLGTQEFVEEIWGKYWRKYTPKRKNGARRMKGGDWNGLMTMRNLQKEVIG